MPESKPRGPQDGSDRERLSGAPPKPQRRVSAIPTALVSSTSALRIPPAPRPPRPPGSRSRSPATAEERPDRASERPVFAEVPQTARRKGGSQRFGAAAVLALAGVLGGAGWYLTEGAAEAPKHVDVKRPEIASNVAAAEDREPGSNSATVIDLDEEEQSRNEADSDQPSSEPKATEAHAPARLPKQAELSGRGHSAPVSDPDNRATLVAASPAEVEQTEVDPAGEAGNESGLVTTKTEGPTSQGQLVVETAADEAPQPALAPFDAEAAKAALTAKASQASSCRAGDDPRGTAEVLITFAPSGRVTSANVSGQPFGGTATGGCIASTLRGASVPPFSGDHVTVRKLVKIH